MKILLIADGRSITTRSWVKTLTTLGYRIVLISTFPCDPIEGVEADVTLPVAFSSLGGSTTNNRASGENNVVRGVVSRTRPFLLAIRYLMGPLTLRYYGPRLRWLIDRIQPDIVHALRIPYEGMLATYTPRDIPLVVSIWGNDLTLHASGSPRMASLTRRTLSRVDALLADAKRDARLARVWGLDRTKPVLIVPGSAGINIEEIQSVIDRVNAGKQIYENIRLENSPLVINPRGFRTGSVRQDTFFQAIPLVLKRLPDVEFICPAMAGQQEAIRWIEKLELQQKVKLLPHLAQSHLWELFAQSDISVSVSQHDGTPNTLLEAMALGAFPISGDIESLREWITPGVNGLLVEPDKPHALADAILTGIENTNLRTEAARINSKIVADRAGSGPVSEKIRLMYEALSASREIPG